MIVFLLYNMYICIYMTEEGLRRHLTPRLLQHASIARTRVKFKTILSFFLSAEFVHIETDEPGMMQNAVLFLAFAYKGQPAGRSYLAPPT